MRKETNMSHYSVNEVSEMLNVSIETVRRWIREGKLNAKRGLGRGGNSIQLEDIVTFVNKPPRLYMKALRKWLDANKIEYQTENAPINPAIMTLPLMGVPGLVSGAATKKLFNDEIIMLNGMNEGTNPPIEETEITKDVLKLSVSLDEREEIDVTSNDNDNYDELILQEKMKLLKLKQEMARISAEISISESQIEYYQMLKNK